MLYNLPELRHYPPIITVVAKNAWNVPGLIESAYIWLLR